MHFAKKMHIEGEGQAQVRQHGSLTQVALNVMRYGFLAPRRNGVAGQVCDKMSNRRLAARRILCARAGPEMIIESDFAL
jgi:hypothetical protein